MATFQDPCPTGYYCWTHRVAVDHDRAFLSTSRYRSPGTLDGSLIVLDIADPANPSAIGRFETAAGSAPTMLALSEKFLHIGISYYSTANGTLLRADVWNSSSLSDAGSVVFPRSIHGISASGDLVAIASGSDGLRIIDSSSPDGPVELSHVTNDRLAPTTSVTSAEAAFIEGDLVYVLLYGGAVEVPGELRRTLAIVDISDPMQPVVLGAFDETRGFSATAIFSDVQVREGVAYVAARDSLRILDVSNPTSPSDLGTFPAEASFDDQPITVAVEGNVAYLGSLERGLRVVDVSDPTSPFQLGRYPVSTVGSDVQAIDVALYNGYAFVSLFRGGLQIIAVDPERDGIDSTIDGCPEIYDPGQFDSDSDGDGDACDPQVPTLTARPDYIRAVLVGLPGFPVDELDPDDLRFGPGQASPASIVVADVNADGLDDLTLDFREDESGRILSDGVACLSGTTARGFEFSLCGPVVLACGLGAEIPLLLVPLLVAFRRTRR